MGKQRKDLKIKVCGMKNIPNIKELAILPIQMMGLIFYEKSPRFIHNLDAKALEDLPSRIQKVGVFVNETESTIMTKIQIYNLKYIQLHGNESPEFCERLRTQNIKVIKAFPIAEAKDLEKIKDYENHCDYFLFDTKTNQYGGSGKKFDWQILSSYSSSTPFFLSGGIGSDDAEIIQQIKHPAFFAIDLNSQFEIAPGLKDIQKLKKFISKL
jgi:phosphoribosylanthranilate isomerase